MCRLWAMVVAPSVTPSDIRQRVMWRLALLNCSLSLDCLSLTIYWVSLASTLSEIGFFGLWVHCYDAIECFSLASSVHWLPLSVIGLLQSHLAAIMSAIKAFWEVSIQTFIMLQWTVWCHHDWRWQSENYLLSLSAIGNIQSSATSRAFSADSVSGDGRHWL